eukprot:Skav223172  [mRNA]  locus=scaffold2044:94291:94918:+ [translate_table: standard]
MAGTALQRGWAARDWHNGHMHSYIQVSPFTPDAPVNDPEHPSQISLPQASALWLAASLEPPNGQLGGDNPQVDVEVPDSDEEDSIGPQLAEAEDSGMAGSQPGVSCSQASPFWRMMNSDQLFVIIIHESVGSKPG